MMAAAIQEEYTSSERPLVPVCASCDRVRDRRGRWRPAAAGLCVHFNAQVTHTLCPDCTARLYPGYARRHHRRPGFAR